MSQIEIAGASIYYEIHGAGHPLILISGYSADHTIWLPVLEYLAKSFQVILFDNRGSGQTKDDVKDLSASLIAKDISILIEKLDLQKPHILGYSMGGTIAQKLAVNHPDQIGKLILLATSSKWRKAIEQAFHSQIAIREACVSDEVLFEMKWPWIFGEKFLSNSKNFEKFKKLYYANPFPQSLKNQRRQLQILDRFDGREDLNKIQAETLVLYGKEDIISLPYESKYLAEKIPNAKIKSIDAAHGINTEAPAQLIEFILKFLI